jgi:hypothetical protein
MLTMDQVLASNQLTMACTGAMPALAVIGFLGYRLFRLMRPPSAKPGQSTLEFRLVMSDVERCLAEVHCSTPVATNETRHHQPVNDAAQPEYYNIDPLHASLRNHASHGNQEFFNLMLPTISEEGEVSPSSTAKSSISGCVHEVRSLNNPSLPAPELGNNERGTILSPHNADYHINYENISSDEYDLRESGQSVLSDVHLSQSSVHSAQVSKNGQGIKLSTVSCTVNPLIARGKLCYHLTRLRIALDRLFLTDYWANSDKDNGNYGSRKQSLSPLSPYGIFGVLRTVFSTVFGSFPSLEIHSVSEFVSVSKDVALLASPDFEVSAQRKLQTAARMRSSYQCLVPPVR